MDSVHHIWCPLFSQEFQDLPDGAETTLTNDFAESVSVFNGERDVPVMSLPEEPILTGNAESEK
ncbi:hypothetical protein ACTULJ_003846 [Escherichia coli]|nr:hypothetical protein [Escherichia coli]